jgi:DNA transformation protein
MRNTRRPTRSSRAVSARKRQQSMRVSDGFRDFVLDQLSSIDQVRARAMFGGVGLYAGETFFGLLAADVLYFKVDDRNRDDYLTAGTGPFHPYANQAMTMSYWGVPLTVLEDPRLLAQWARRAIDVAQSPRVPIRAARRSRTGANKARPTSERVWWLNKSRLRGR